ncbi:MAG: hypothetical protein BWY70_00495 [Bacteroidetes bacterium ADurb.Bin408]|nr:MAG: hypothetical protein BWY70_00495 [Bacteroidetes bacterium ADurb.Bin408]
MKIQNVLIYLALVFMLCACEKAFDWQYNEQTALIPVVEGIITNENVKQIVVLSYVRSQPNAPAIPVTSASVNVNLAGNTFAFAQDTTNPGTYISEQAFIGVVDAPVTLNAFIDGVRYTATDNMIPVSNTQRANFKLVDTNDSLYEIVSPASTFYSTEPAMWVLDIDWSSLPACNDSTGASCKAKVFYYDLKTLDVSEVFAPDKQTLRFPKGASVLQTKYSLSPEHAEFRRSLLLETVWRGGLFDVSPGTVYTNVSGGALGFFGASSVVKRTYTVQ